MIFSSSEQQHAIAALERGEVIYLPHLPFEFNSLEQEFLTPIILDGSTKNISLNPSNQAPKGTIYRDEPASRLAALMARFSTMSTQLINNVIPRYQKAIIMGRTSYRPAEIEGRKSSILKDDTRLHVDAFPATPNQGRRILRVFSNVNPYGKTRDWHLGEPFIDVVNYFKDNLRKPIIGSRALMALLKITKTYRSLYDHYMLSLHNQMKLSDIYQKKVTKTDMRFPAGSTWIVMTDQVSHAALAGQFVLEQTFYLPVSAMLEPYRSPLHILENTLNCQLINA